jgi:ring-1,2-phenylacetyl-CoA epoxidase subunit PaaC
MDARVTAVKAPENYLLHLADNALVLGQRNAEWCGHGPILEEDIAMANVSLDLIGQARLLYQLVAERRGDGCTEDALAYFRDVPQFRNYTLVELPHHGPLVGYAVSERDYATTLVRNFLYSAWMVEVWAGLSQAADPELSAIAERSLKETRYAGSRRSSVDLHPGVLDPIAPGGGRYPAGAGLGRHSSRLAAHRRDRIDTGHIATTS